MNIITDPHTRWVWRDFQRRLTKLKTKKDRATATIWWWRVLAWFSSYITRILIRHVQLYSVDKSLQPHDDINLNTMNCMNTTQKEQQETAFKCLKIEHNTAPVLKPLHCKPTLYNKNWCQSQHNMSNFSAGEGIKWKSYNIRKSFSGTRRMKLLLLSSSIMLQRIETGGECSVHIKDPYAFSLAHIWLPLSSPPRSICTRHAQREAFKRHLTFWWGESRGPHRQSRVSIYPQHPASRRWKPPGRERGNRTQALHPPPPLTLCPPITPCEVHDIIKDWQLFETQASGM